VLQVNFKKQLVYGSIAAIWIVMPAYITTMGGLTTDIIKGTCIPWGIYSSFAAEKTITSSIFAIALLFPFTLMVFCYSRIVYELKHKVLCCEKFHQVDNLIMIQLLFTIK